MFALRQKAAAFVAGARDRIPRTRRDWALALAQLAAIVIVLVMIVRASSPMFFDLSTYGGHDWDEVLAHRLIVRQALRDYFQFPGWNPYACGGFAAWSNPQGAAVLVSPLLPLYLIAELRLALRLEVVFAALCAAWGTWLWTSRYTKSPALRAFACVAFVVNGRWALQTASGHSLHFYYAWMPWVFYGFDRALERAEVERFPLRPLAGASVMLALMVYNAAIYPLPHTIFLLGVYAAVHAIALRKLRPLVFAAVIVAFGLALAAPKLLPVLHEMARFPRTIDSPESMDLNALIQALLARGQTMGTRPARVEHWGWHEYGMYVGAGVLLPVLVAALAPHEKRERALCWAGGIALVLALGSFHPFAPWTLLHELPVYRSQHVPSRWLYPAAMFFGVLVAAVGERWLGKLQRTRPLLEAVLLIAVLPLALDISAQSARAMRGSFWMQMKQLPQTDGFKQHYKVPPELQYVRLDYGPPAVPAMMARAGVVECGTLHVGYGVWGPKGKNGRSIGQGARGAEEPDYRGEAYTLSGTGQARIAHFTPNEFVVEYSGARPGDVLILNQNFSEGWRAGGQAAFSQDDKLGVRLPAADGRLVFSYTPPRLWWGVGVALLAIAIALFAERRLRAFPSRPV